MGSACELEYQVLLGHDLGYLSAADYDTLQMAVRNVKRMLAGFIVRVRGKKAGRARS